MTDTSPSSTPTPPSTPSLVVTDLDNTLWHTADSVPDVVLDAVAELGRRGIPLLVATGRRLGATVVPLRRLGIDCPMVVLNGALGVEADATTRFHQHSYPSEDAARVLAAFRSVGWDPVIQVDRPDIEVFLSEKPSTHPDHVAALTPFAATGDLDRVVAEEQVLGFSLLGVDMARAQGAADAIGDLAQPHLDRSIDFPGAASLTVSPFRRSKWDGVAAYCETYALDSEAVLCLADGANDLELLDHSAVALVPSGGHAEALARADHLIAPAAEGGWAEVLDFV